jgi:hypothetical protein
MFRAATGGGKAELDQDKEDRVVINKQRKKRKKDKKLKEGLRLEG